MRFTETLFAGAALVAAAYAVQPEINEFPKTVEAGKSYTVTYSPGGDIPTTFILRKGKNEDLDTLTTLTTSATGGEFQWSVDSSLADAEDYALEIRQPNEEPNYIGPIELTGGTEATSSASSSSASATKTTSSTATGKSTMITTTTSSSVSGMPTMSGNGTLPHTGSATPSATGTGTEEVGAPESTGAASALASSPLALIFGAAAAMMYLN